VPARCSGYFILFASSIAAVYTLSANYQGTSRAKHTKSVMVSSIVFVDVHSPLSNRGTRSLNIQLVPAAPTQISNNCFVSKPTLAPRDIASIADTRCTAAIAAVTNFSLESSSDVAVTQAACLRTRSGSFGRYTRTSPASSSNPNPALTPVAKTCSVAEDRNSGKSALLPPAFTIPCHKVSSIQPSSPQILHSQHP